MHHRRRSGYASGNTSLTDVRKAVTASDPAARKHSSRPAAMTRRITPQTIPKLGKTSRDREKEWDQDHWWDEERESFPQYWYVIKTLFLVALFFSFSLYVSQLRLWGPFPSEDFHFHQPALSPDMQMYLCHPSLRGL